MSKKSGNSFVKQASILMVAGLIVRVIGLLYRSPMREIIGDLGNGYYGYAYTVYSILLLISSYSIPMAISKLMAERIALKQYRNANKLFKGALLYACVVGGIAALAAWFGGRYLLPAGGENAILALKVLSPTIFLCAILGVMRGYFQAHNTMLPTSVSQIVEQLVNAIVSVAASWLFIQWFASTETEHAIYGAAGGTLGTGAGVLAGVICMLFVFAANRRNIQKRLDSDTSGVEDSYKVIFKTILMMVTPVIFSTCIYNLSAYLDQSFFAPIMMSNGWQADDINIQYGIFSGQYMVMINIPIALANAASTAVLPSVSGSFATGDMAGARHKINEAVQMTMFLCIPAAVGMGVLADPIMHLLFPTTTAMAGKLLMAGAVSVIFYSLSTITNGVLQGIGKPSIPVRHAAVSLVLNVAVLCALTKFTGLGIYSVLIATIVYSLSMCILNGRSVTKHLDYHMDIKGMFMKPLLASLLMGVAALVVYYGLHRVVSSNVICLVPAIIVAVLVYGVAYLVIAKPSRELLRKMPGGAYLVKIAAKFRIFS